MSAYFDASCFARIVLKDDGWAAIGEWLEAIQAPAILSDFGWGEFVSAVALRVRMRRLTTIDGKDVIATAATYRDRWRMISIGSDDIADATAFVVRFDLGLRLPDAIHIAIARRHGYTLVTTDHQQLRAARALGVAAIDPTLSSEDLST